MPRLRKFSAHALKLVRRAGLGIGDRVVLNSGGPIGFVVDILGEHVTVAYQRGDEITAPRVCFTKVGDD